MFSVRKRRATTKTYEKQNQTINKTKDNTFSRF